jgi:hypothetical protein
MDDLNGMDLYGACWKEIGEATQTVQLSEFFLYFYFDFTKINSRIQHCRNSHELPFETAVGLQPPFEMAVKVPANRQFKRRLEDPPRGPLARHLPPRTTAAGDQPPL